MVANCAVLIENNRVSSTMPSKGEISKNLTLKKIENRRNNKPIMEKRRRARINNCLNELKGLILEITKKNPARYSKLEKADILEMTVKYLQSKKKNGPNDGGADHFKAGFGFCANAISKCPSLDFCSKRKLLHHISSYWNQELFRPANNQTTVENGANPITSGNLSFLAPTSTSSAPRNLSSSPNSPDPSQSLPLLLPYPQRTFSVSSIDEDKPISLVTKRRIDEEMSSVWRPF